MKKERIPVYLGTSLNPSAGEMARACAASMVMFDKGFLPVMPYIYGSLFNPQGDDLTSLRLQLMHGVRDALFVGQPTEAEAALAVELGLNCRYSFHEGELTIAHNTEAAPRDLEAQPLEHTTG
jgi:hypothetical protein